MTAVLPNQTVGKFPESLKAPIQDWSEVYRHAGNYIRAVIHNNTPNPTDAEDVFQLTMLRAWQYRDRFTPGEPIVPLLAVMAVRTCYDQYRHQTRLRGGPDRASNIDKVPESVITEASFEEEVVDREMVEYLRTIVTQELSQRSLDIFDAVAAGDTEREIADKLGIPQGTVKSRMHRLRYALRQHVTLDE